MIWSKNGGLLNEILLEKIFNINNNKKKEKKTMKTKVINEGVYPNDKVKYDSSELVEFNSKDAAKFFELNCYKGQRNLRPKRIDKYVNEIKDGWWFTSLIVVAVWQENGKEIKAILDGQHRLQAIINLNTLDKRRLNILYIYVDKKHGHEFYKKFDSGSSSRSLGDLVKMNLSRTTNEGRWQKPVELIRALQYGSGIYFTKKSVFEEGLTKDEFMASWVFLKQYEETFDFIDNLKQLMKNTTDAYFGTAAWGAVMNSYITNKKKAEEFWMTVVDYGQAGRDVSEDNFKLIKSMFVKVNKIKRGGKEKGENIASQNFYIFYRGFQNYCNDTATFSKLWRKGTKADILKACFSSGKTLLPL